MPEPRLESTLITLWIPPVKKKHGETLLREFDPGWVAIQNPEQGPFFGPSALPPNPQPPTGKRLVRRNPHKYEIPWQAKELN